jgi:hypothetical protein
MKKLLSILAALVLTVGFTTPVFGYAYTADAEFAGSTVSDGLSLCYGSGFAGDAIITNKHNTMNVIESWRKYSAINHFNSQGFCDEVGTENIRVRPKDLGSCHVGPYMSTQTEIGFYTVATIWVNSDCYNKNLWYWGTSTVPVGKPDGPSMLAHEVGHAMGICHSDNPASFCTKVGTASTKDLMDQFGPMNADCTEEPEIMFTGRRLVAPSLDDGNAINRLYPSYALPGPFQNVSANCVA